MTGLLQLSCLLLIYASSWTESEAWMPVPQSFTVNDMTVQQDDLIHKIWTEIFFSLPKTEKKELLQASATSDLFRPTNSSAANITEILGFTSYSKLAEKNKAQGVVQPLPVDHVSTDDLLWSAYNKEIEHFVTRAAGREGRAKDDYPEVSSQHLRLMLENVFQLPRCDELDSDLKSAIRMYITRKLYSYNLLSVNHVFQFQPTDLAALAKKFDLEEHLQAALAAQGSEEPAGVNVVGVLPGRHWGTAQDRLLIIGAHYDTVPETPGLDDNGSGVVALLEAARALSENGCQPQYSILFVAFDLEERGGVGSLAFIHHVLYTEVLEPAGWPTVQGAFILDTVMNYNATSGAQSVPYDWVEQLNETVGRIEKRDGRGDFLAAIYRRHVEQPLVDVFEHHYHKLDGSDRFTVERFDADLPAKKPEEVVLFNHMDLMRSDHSRFWYVSRDPANRPGAPETIPAVLLTDTGPYRGVMAACYHSSCDNFDHMMADGAENVPFLVHTTQALVNTLVDLSSATCSGQPLTEPPPPLPSVGSRAELKVA